jgi:hypothetical protein
MTDPCESQTYVALQGGLNFEDSDVPEHTQGALTRYFYNHYNPGGFVTSALALDIESANARADSWNKSHVPSIFQWIEYNLPEECYGSYEKVRAWCDKR